MCARDFIKPWFDASEELGDFIGIRFGRIPPESTEPEWMFKSHAEYDGIGGLADILRSKGAGIETLPENTHPAMPSWKPFFAMAHEYLLPRQRVRIAESRRSAGKAHPQKAPQAAAWHVFSREETARIQKASKKHDITVNSFLFAHLNAAVFPDIPGEHDSIPWMIPVNLRGKTARPKDTDNHASFVRAEISRSDDMQAVHRKIYAELEKGAHWGNWKAYSATRMLPQAARKTLIRGDRITSKWLFGAFSNLGEWNSGGELSVSETDGDWLFAPPAVSFFKAAAGCITWNGKLSLCMNLHPEISTDPLFARSWIDRWVESIEKNWH
ncbi:MAG: hypothetical protein JXP39_08015 [Spirochaetales bacterium]|nr:hypothetical protein [Spirochaetales bacterium]